MRMLAHLIARYRCGKIGPLAPSHVAMVPLPALVRSQERTNSAGRSAQFSAKPRFATVAHARFTAMCLPGQNGVPAPSRVVRVTAVVQEESFSMHSTADTNAPICGNLDTAISTLALLTALSQDGANGVLAPKRAVVASTLEPAMS